MFFWILDFGFCSSWTGGGEPGRFSSGKFFFFVGLGFTALVYWDDFPFSVSFFTLPTYLHGAVMALLYAYIHTYLVYLQLVYVIDERLLLLFFHLFFFLLLLLGRR